MHSLSRTLIGSVIAAVGIVWAFLFAHEQMPFDRTLALADSKAGADVSCNSPAGTERSDILFVNCGGFF